MPTTLSTTQALVWIVFGFCVGVGWSIGGWLVSAALNSARRGKTNG